MSTPDIVDVAEIAPPAHLDDGWFSADGCVIEDMGAVLGAFDVTPTADLAETLPDIENIGVHLAASGIIQDPAGSAVGSKILSGGGASGAIYAAFPDLLPIPEMGVGAAVFNPSTGPGRRLLHSHSPRLSGDPGNADDRATALVALADGYANALLAASAQAGKLGADGASCNLVPISGAIFAGRFQRADTFAMAHLDPSYTLVALTVAIDDARARGAAIPRLTLCYFAADVARRAADVRAALRQALLNV